MGPGTYLRAQPCFPGSKVETFPPWREGRPGSRLCQLDLADADLAGVAADRLLQREENGSALLNLVFGKANARDVEITAITKLATIRGAPHEPVPSISGVTQDDTLVPLIAFSVDKVEE